MRWIQLSSGLDNIKNLILSFTSFKVYLGQKEGREGFTSGQKFRSHIAVGGLTFCPIGLLQAQATREGHTCKTHELGLGLDLDGHKQFLIILGLLITCLANI